MLFILLGSMIVVFLAMWFCYRIAFYSPRPHKDDPHTLPPGEQYQRGQPRMHALIDEMEAIPCERVSIRSHDGLLLSGRYYHVRDGAPLQIQMHGYRGNGIRDFCGGNKIARENGQNTLVIDQRAQGESEGCTIAFGVLERYDCLAWIRYAIDRFGPDTQIFLSGVSMGAATVLMAAALDLPENVRGVIADSPYSSPEAIIQKVAGDMKLPSRLAWPFVRLSARVFGRFDPCACSVVESVRRAKVPILIIHGEDDRFVPCGMSREIAAANPEKVRLETFPDAGHGLSYIEDTQRYIDASTGFLRSLSEK